MAAAAPAAGVVLVPVLMLAGVGEGWKWGVVGVDLGWG